MISVLISVLIYLTNLSLILLNSGQLRKISFIIKLKSGTKIKIFENECTFLKHSKEFFFGYVLVNEEIIKINLKHIKIIQIMNALIEFFTNASIGQLILGVIVAALVIRLVFEIFFG